MIPIVCGILYALGGQVNKWFRWIGIGIYLYLVYHNPLVILTYFIATQFPYGEKSWLNFLGEWGKFLICGIALGFASIPILGYIGTLQGIISGLAFILIKYLDAKNIIKNPYVEFLRGAIGTCLLF